MVECEITKIEGGFKIVSPDKTVELTDAEVKALNQFILKGKVQDAVAIRNFYGEAPLSAINSETYLRYLTEEVQRAMDVDGDSFRDAFDSVFRRSQYPVNIPVETAKLIDRFYVDAGILECNHPSITRIVECIKSGDLQKIKDDICTVMNCDDDMEEAGTYILNRLKRITAAN